MRNARRLILYGCAITGLPALTLLVLATSGIWAGGHDGPTVIILQALGACMAVSAILLAMGVSRAIASLLSSPVARDPLNLATSAIGLVALVAITWFGWHMFVG